MGRRTTIKKPIEEQLTDQQLARLEEEHLFTEAEVIQQEIVSRIPGFATFLKRYELRPLLKILASIGVIVAVFFLTGWETSALGFTLFAIATGLSYLLQIKNQDRDSTIVVESKLAGQKITRGDNTPSYDHDFMVMESRFAIWEVPNILIRNGLFQIPGDQQSTFLPGTGNFIFVDLFDRINRTCVLPKDMDVSNIAFYTNANSMITSKLETEAQRVQANKEREQAIKDEYSIGRLSEQEAYRMLQPIKIETKALMNPNRKTKRDIFFEYQRLIPLMGEKITELQNKEFLIADVIASRRLYGLFNRNMPEEIKKSHKSIGSLLGIPYDG